MEKITSLNRQSVRFIGDIAQKELEKVFQDYGIRVEKLAGSYTDDEYKVRFVFSLDSGKSTEEVDRERFAKEALFVGLNPEDFGRMISVYGSNYKIVGIKSSARKNKILVLGANGKRYRMSALMVKSALDLKNKIV